MSQIIALATMHGKADQVAPHFHRLTDWRVEVAEIDTDQFGTFSGDIPRRSSQKETAIQKALAGAKHLGVDFGLSGEGVIAPHPQIPFVPINFEIMAFTWVSRGINILESHHSTEIKAHSIELNEDTELEVAIEKFDMPNHAVNLYGKLGGENIILKGIREPEKLLGSINSLKERSVVELRIENDYRAMSSPSRQANISACAEKLATRLSTSCPACQEIGWGKVGYVYGVDCEACGEVVLTIANSEKFGCISCPYTEVAPLGQTTVGPERCNVCNP